MITFAACRACGSEGDLQLPPLGSRSSLACPNCGSLVTTIAVTPWRDYITAAVASMLQKQRAGLVGTRKQAYGRSDADIDREGREAELAACLILCPGFREQWFSTTGPNRGRDLPPEWTELDKPAEIKQTRYKDKSRGYLLVRPPRWTPGPMRKTYIEDAIYVLMHGHDELYTMLGWTDRKHLLSAGRLNPVPVRPGQRECFGIHWSRLFTPESIITASGNEMPRT